MSITTSYHGQILMSSGLHNPQELSEDGLTADIYNDNVQCMNGSR